MLNMSELEWLATGNEIMYSRAENMSQKILQKDMISQNNRNCCKQRYRRKPSQANQKDGNILDHVLRKEQMMPLSKGQNLIFGVIQCLTKDITCYHA